MDHDNLLSPDIVENDLNYDFVRKLSNIDSSNINFDNPFYEINFDSRYFEELEFCEKYRNNDNLSLITWNIQSLNSKFEGLLEFISNLNNFNAAIASNTGSYTGYSFAIPVNIVKKVVNDFINRRFRQLRNF